MNDPSVFPPTDEETPVTQGTPRAPISQIECLIRRHPLAAGLATVGIGCAIGLVARELLMPPPSPRNRILHLLEEIQDRLHEYADPVYDQASHLADDGVKAAKRGMDAAASSKLGSRLSHLFS
jgi:ElaB/YqjD/DUF883 family membrane-anchored ribosome-binding protein